MGRSSQRKRNRQRANARRRQQSARSRAVKKAQAPTPSTTAKSGYAPAIENTMFFMRLRRGSKWAMIVVMFAFAFTFLFAGVGSGGSGGDVIQELLGMRGGNPVKSAESEVSKHPKSARALSALALAYDGADRRGDAINTYKKYLKLKPNDTSVLSQLARLQSEVAALRFARYERMQSRLMIVYGPLRTDPLATLAGADSLLSAYSNTLTSQLSSAYNSYTLASREWESTSKLYVKAVPATDTFQRANVELQLAQAASSAGDYPVAIKAYEDFMKLVPKDTRVPQVKKILAELRKANSSG